MFDQGKIRVVVGEGGYLPCLHSKIVGMTEGDKKTFDSRPLVYNFRTSAVF